MNWFSSGSSSLTTAATILTGVGSIISIWPEQEPQYQGWKGWPYMGSPIDALRGDCQRLASDSARTVATIDTTAKVEASRKV